MAAAKWQVVGRKCTRDRRQVLVSNKNNRDIGKEIRCEHDRIGAPDSQHNESECLSSRCVAKCISKCCCSYSRWPTFDRINVGQTKQVGKLLFRTSEGFKGRSIEALSRQQVKEIENLHLPMRNRNKRFSLLLSAPNVNLEKRQRPKRRRRRRRLRPEAVSHLKDITSELQQVPSFGLSHVRASKPHGCVQSLSLSSSSLLVIALVLPAVICLVRLPFSSSYSSDAISSWQLVTRNMPNTTVAAPTAQSNTTNFLVIDSDDSNDNKLTSSRITRGRNSLENLAPLALPLNQRQFSAANQSDRQQLGEFVASRRNYRHHRRRRIADESHSIDRTNKANIELQTISHRSNKNDDDDHHHHNQSANQSNSSSFFAPNIIWLSARSKLGLHGLGSDVPKTLEDVQKEEVKQTRASSKFRPLAKQLNLNNCQHNLTGCEPSQQEEPFDGSLDANRRRDRSLEPMFGYQSANKLPTIGSLVPQSGAKARRRQSEGIEKVVSPGTESLSILSDSYDQKKSKKQLKGKFLAPSIAYIFPETTGQGDEDQILSSLSSTHYVANKANDLMVQSNDHDVEELYEYDNLFLLHDYRPKKLLSNRMATTKALKDVKMNRDRRSDGAASSYTFSPSDKTTQVQTIYFGGFFPWLADENAQFHSGGQAQESHFNTMINSFDEPQRTSNLNSDHSISNDKQSIRQKQRRKGKTSRQQQHQDNVTLSGQLQANNHKHQLNHQQTMTSANAQYTSESRHQLGKFILPAVRLALDHINTNHSVLAAYKLEVVPRDTQCNATISLKQFFDMVYEAPKKMLLYGDACRVSTDPIAKASYFFDLIQISYADTDPIYTIENYPNFFRVVPSENALSLARIPFIRHFNWTRVGTIYQNLPRYSLPHSKLLTDLERYRIVIKQSVSLPGSVDGLQNRDLGDELRKLKEKDVRIILGNFDEEWALLLFCEAFREKMIGRKYQWLLTGFSEAKLWHFYENKGSSCSKQELLIAMDGYIITDITPVTRSQHKTVSGMMAHEYSDEYKRRAREMSISIEENKFYGYVYDGIWAIALALDRVDNLLKHYNQLARDGKVKLKSELEGITSLLDFEYHKPIWVKLIRDALNKTRFDGVTGTVSFHKNERPGLITFSQFQAFRDMNEVVIGSYDALNDELDLKVGFPIFWRGSSPPIDHTIQRVTPFRVNRTLFVIISIMAILGIVLACVFLFVNIKFRNQRYIKMSSPYLNNLIIIGCILTFTSVIILGLDSGLTSEYNFPYICNARAWVLMAGFTLAFGSMFSKTFRVHSIFTNIKLHKKVIKDYKLFMVVFILLTFDVCILIVWQYFDPFYRETNNGTSIQDPDNEDVIIVPEMEHCQSKRMTIFLGVIYVYKGLLMAFGCFLAWETRHVSIPALNDSKYIGLSVYNVVIMCVVGASLSFVLRDQQDASFVIISIFIIFCSTATLCLVFVPKLIELKQNPRASDHRVRATLKTFKKNYHEEALGAAAGCRDIHGNIIGRGYGITLNDKIKILLEENVRQRSLLKEKTYELEALTSKYRKIQSMVQSGQYLQAINTTAGPTTASPVPQGSSSINKTTGSTTLLLTSRSPTRERVSFSLLKDDRQTATNIIRAPRAPVELTNRPGLSSSPLMSSATQLTTTNTTSSTNNTTDLTADYSSSRLISTATTSTNGCQRSSDELNDRVMSAAGQQQTVISDGKTLMDSNKRGILKPVLFDRHQQALASTTEQQPTRNSKTAGELRHPYEDSNLFTVLSFINNDRRQSEEALARDHGKEEGRKFGQWLEGPFCTMMLRQASLDSKQFRTSLKRQSSQQHSRSLRTLIGKESLPRTLSMIEYLGLNDFDLIARRHDKILRYKRNRNRLSCCYETNSCSCCASHSRARAQVQAKLSRSHGHQSDGNIAFSSSDPLNSDDLLQTSVSCSTCCSLASQTYASQSDIFHEQAHTSPSVSSSSSSQSTRSSLTRSSTAAKPRYFSESTETSSQSSSLMDQTTSMTAPRFCHLHPYHYQQQQHHQHLHDYHVSSRLHHHYNRQQQQHPSQDVPRSLQTTPPLQQHNQHPKHHHSSEAMSTNSSIVVSLSKQPKVSGIHEHSLCTSGVLYGAPGSKEDANDAAQVVEPIASTSGEPTSISSNAIEDFSQAINDDRGTEDRMRTKISIKCDVLESL